MRVDLHDQRHALIHRDGWWLRAAHLPSPAVRTNFLSGCPSPAAAPAIRASHTCPAKCPVCRCNPQSGRHLAVHHQPWRSSASKCSCVAQCGTRLELAISTRGASVGAEDADRLAGLDEERFVASARAGSANRIERIPVARPARARRRRSGWRGLWRHPGRGCSSTSGNAASCCQPLQVSSVPRGARSRGSSSSLLTFDSQTLWTGIVASLRETDIERRVRLLPIRNKRSNFMVVVMI